MGKFSIEMTVGGLLAIFLGIIAGLPLAFQTFWGSWSGLYATLFTGDLTTLACAVIFMIIGALIFGLAGGYLGINDKSDGVAVGAMAGLVAFGMFLLYLVWEGTVVWTFPVTYAILDYVYMGLSLIFVLVISAIIYKVGSDAKS